METKKKGRQKLNAYTTSYKIQREAIQRVLRYFYQSNVRELFKNGVLSYGVAGSKISIVYQHTNGDKHFMEFEVELGNRRWADELRMLVQDFIVDTFMLYEWDGQPVQPMNLARLFGVSRQNISNILKRVIDKLASREEFS